MTSGGFGFPKFQMKSSVDNVVSGYVNVKYDKDKPPSSIIPYFYILLYGYGNDHKLIQSTEEKVSLMSNVDGRSLKMSKDQSITLQGSSGTYNNSVGVNPGDVLTFSITGYGAYVIGSMSTDKKFATPITSAPFTLLPLRIKSSGQEVTSVLLSESYGPTTFAFRHFLSQTMRITSITFRVENGCSLCGDGAGMVKNFSAKNPSTGTVYGTVSAFSPETQSIQTMMLSEGGVSGIGDLIYNIDKNVAFNADLSEYSYPSFPNTDPVMVATIIQYTVKMDQGEFTIELPK